MLSGVYLPLTVIESLAVQLQIFEVDDTNDPVEGCHPAPPVTPPVGLQPRDLQVVHKDVSHVGSHLR